MDLHNYIKKNADTFYAHALNEDTQIVQQINTDTNEAVNLTAILKENFQPLDVESLKKLCDLVDILTEVVNKKEEKIKS